MRSKCSRPKSALMVIFGMIALMSVMVPPPAAMAGGGKAPVDIPGDWPQVGYDPQHDGYNSDETILTPNSVPSMHVVWTLPGLKDVESAGALIAGSTVFTTKVFGTDPMSGSVVEALDLHTGQLIWSFSKWTARQNIRAGVVALADGALLVGETSDCGFQCRHHRLDSLDAGTGAVLWSVPIEDPNGGILVADGEIYLGEGVDQVARSAADGSELWRTHIGSGTINMTVGGGHVFLSSYDTKIRALNAATGHGQWTVACGCDAFARMPYVGGVLYVPESNTSLTARDGATGQVIWSIATQANGSPLMAVADGRIYFADYVGRVLAVRASDGARLWRTRLGELYDDILYPAVAGGVVYFGLTNGPGSGSLFALKASNGAVRWSYPISTFDPTVSHGMLFAGSNPPDGDAGALYAFGL